MILWKIFYTEIEACDSYDQVWYSYLTKPKQIKYARLERFSIKC